MILRELRDILTHLPEDISLDIPVLVKGYEGGYKDLERNYIAVKTVCFGYRASDYYGPHELREDSYFLDEEEEAKARFGLALIIDRSTVG